MNEPASARGRKSTEAKSASISRNTGSTQDFLTTGTVRERRRKRRVGSERP
jgi:hypothetical protein